MLSVVAATEIPHFDYPFAFQQAGGTVTAAVVEQDTLEEVLACAQAICDCPVGFRHELPEFGIQAPLFSQAPLDPSGVQRAVEEWEPRALTLAGEYPDGIGDFFRHLQLDVELAP